MPNKLVAVSSYSSRIEAEIAKGFLESNGIKAVVSADDAGGARPFPLSYEFGVELKVGTKDLNRAKKILKAK